MSYIKKIYAFVKNNVGISGAESSRKKLNYIAGKITFCEKCLPEIKFAEKYYYCISKKQECILLDSVKFTSRKVFQNNRCIFV